MRVATCTPVDFPADAQFFGRDSGLLCRGFQAAGHEAVVVMPGVRGPDDAADLVRCGYQDLESESWWRALGVDLVVLYAWGDPRYRATAEAIRSAGICLVQSLDTAGLTTPYGNTREWWQCFIGMLAAPRPASSKLRLLTKTIRDLCPSLYETKRLAMIDICDRLAVVSAPAAQSIADYARALGYPRIATKTLIAPHPVSPLMQPPAEAKQPMVLVVGRWFAEDTAQKDPRLTMAVIGDFLKARPAWTAEVVGRGCDSLNPFTRGWEPETRSRLTLTEALPREELVSRYQRSRILLCCSRFESFHIASAEALCCGCAIVVADHPLLASTTWFTTRDSGTLAPRRTTAALTAALLEETGAWDAGRRNPSGIAGRWCATLGFREVAAGIIAATTASHCD
jgi:glycosyltransferase involved in cell wall biosynthesis